MSNYYFFESTREVLKFSLKTKVWEQVSLGTREEETIEEQKEAAQDLFNDLISLETRNSLTKAAVSEIRRTEPIMSKPDIFQIQVPSINLTSAQKF